jgi:MATE family multidrug resistance protein
MTLDHRLPDASYAGIWRAAWPIVLANAAVPLLGLADTAVLGRLAGVEQLGALALGAMIFNFVYWTFGFLRMGTTGFVAQARGAGADDELWLAVARALLLGAVIGVGLIALSGPIGGLSLAAFDASDGVESVARGYVSARIWGAPATLCSFGLMGTLIGLGQSRSLLVLQVFANGLNVALDLLFAGALGWGARGIGLGTAISEWAAALLGGVLVLRALRAHGARGDAPRLDLRRLLALEGLRVTLGAHANIMLRTLLMLLAFGWFTRQSARFGDATLAANHVLLQLVSFSAFFLDGFAFATESMVGAAAGARRARLFDDVVRRSSRLAALTALGLCAGIFLLGDVAVRLLTDLEAVRRVAGQHLAYAVAYVGVAVAAFQLDGIFIGVTRTADMRNCSLVSALVFLAAGVPLTARFGNAGLWLAFVLYAAARGISLALLYPGLRRSALAPASDAGAD